MMENQGEKETPRWMVAVVIIQALGLIGILLSPYLPDGVGLAVPVLTVTVVLPLVFWCVKWLQFRSLLRREAAALRRGNGFETARVRTERTLIEEPWGE